MLSLEGLASPAIEMRRTLAHALRLGNGRKPLIFGNKRAISRLAF
jgi:hypothetical protein